MKGLLGKLALHTVCQSAKCPNLPECFSRGTATFMILGDICTRNCRFCAVEKGMPRPLDPEEPHRVAQAAQALGLSHVVVTSVSRDDLPDGGAEHFAATIRAIRRALPEAGVEVLIPDFKGDLDALRTVVEAGPDVLNHNLETVPRLYPRVRPQADYRRSLKVLKVAKEFDGTLLTKSGLMLGLGEEKGEILKVMEDLRRVGCDLLTLGQYLAPSEEHHPVIRFIPPEEFDKLKLKGEEMGFSKIASGPPVRSSYQAGEMLFKKGSFNRRWNLGEMALALHRLH